MVSTRSLSTRARSRDPLALPPSPLGLPPARLRRRHFLGVDFRLEADQQFAAEIEHRPLDHRGLLQHQSDGLAFVQAFPVAVGQFAERGAGAIEQRFPAEFIGPLLEFFLGDAFGLVVMETVSYAMAVEPGARLLHGVAVLDAVYGGGQSQSSRKFAGQ